MLRDRGPSFAVWSRRVPRRRSIRLRLTMLYGALFLLAGTGLVVMTNVLVRHTTPASITIEAGGKTLQVSGERQPASSGVSLLPPVPAAFLHPHPAAFAKTSSASGSVLAAGTSGSPPAEVPGADQVSGGRIRGTAQGAGPSVVVVSDQVGAVRLKVAQAEVLYRANELHVLLVYSLVALGMMAALSVALGWFVAGRVLRPLRTITATARQISATNLNRRLGLTGRDDELKELGDTFDDLLARLERSFEAQRRFVAQASHELRTPLARQRAVAQVAISDPEATVDSLRLAHERVLAAGAQQEAIIDALLTLARGEAGSGRQRPVDLAAVAGEALHMAAPEIERRGLRLTESLDPAVTVANTALVERLVGNLVDNAVRHNVDGGELVVACATRSGRAVLSIANDGPHIAPGEIERLLQPFERLNPERTAHAEGLGLGLSIVKAVADAHAATLQVRTRAAGGLVVDVEFPAPASRPGQRAGDLPPRRGRLGWRALAWRARRGTR